jgi:ParB-like chromosome segregation protein Spo0J
MAQYHDLANAFPMMSDDEFAALVEDIDKNGLLHPVVMFEGKILDGRNRYEACQKLGIAHREIQFKGDDPASFVASENLRRRHLTPTQLAVAAEALANAMQGRPRSAKADPEVPEHVAPVTTISKAAELTGASPTAIKRVRKVKKDGAPEVVAAMESGEITATAAEALTTLPKDEQAAAVAAGAKEAAKKANAADAARRAAGSAKQKPQTRLNAIMEDPDVLLITELSKVFEEHAEIVPKLNRDKALLFAKKLRDARTATSRVIKMIEDAHK